MIKFLVNYIFTAIEVFLLIKAYLFSLTLNWHHHNLICWIILPLLFILCRFAVGSSFLILMVKIGNEELWQNYLKKLKK